jgi:hypothetical protein
VNGCKPLARGHPVQLPHPSRRLLPAQHGGAASCPQGRAVQVDPIKPKLKKPPGTKRLKVNCDVLLSTSAFKLNLRRYTKELPSELGNGNYRVAVSMKDGAG